MEETGILEKATLSGRCYLTLNQVAGGSKTKPIRGGWCGSPRRREWRVAGQSKVASGSRTVASGQSMRGGGDRGDRKSPGPTPLIFRALMAAGTPLFSGSGNDLLTRPVLCDRRSPNPRPTAPRLKNPRRTKQNHNDRSRDQRALETNFAACQGTFELRTHAPPVASGYDAK